MKQLLTLLILLFSTSLFAKDFGIIEGRITDKLNGNPLVSANVIVLNSHLSTTTDSKGYYKIDKIPIGKQTIRASYVGYDKLDLKVDVKENISIKLDFQLNASSMDLEDLIVDSDKTFMETISSNSIRISKRSSGYYAPTDINNNFNTEEYSKIDESGFFNVVDNPLSTFAADIDGASYSNARRFLLNDQLPYKDAIRSEEFINYFSYDYDQPNGDDPLSINMEYSECPWNDKNNLVHIGLKGKQLSKEEQKPSNLVFLLDVSGSMNSPKKLPLLKRSFKLLVDNLNESDKVAIVVYAGNAGLVLPSTYADEKQSIIKALDKLQAGGSTAGGAGIQLAYKVAKENFIAGGNNRVILATDGDFNVGISSTSELTRYIEEKRDDGIFLTVLGFGTGNYKDHRMQELADRGNGNHAYIDNILEAKKVLVNEITSTLFTIAKDVKIQVEFNPAKVKSYRLIGYENRHLENKDFTDDTKDAGEIGAGHTVTALYEVTPADGNLEGNQELKYQSTSINDAAYSSNDILTVKIRYKEPDENKSKEIVEILKDNKIELDNTSDNFRFSAAVAQFAMLLRDSEFKGNSSIKSISKLGQSSKGKDKFGYRSEFLNLVERSGILMSENREASIN